MSIAKPRANPATTLHTALHTALHPTLHTILHSTMLQAAWTQAVSEATSACQLLEALLLLEACIDRAWLEPWYVASDLHRRYEN